MELTDSTCGYDDLITHSIPDAMLIDGLMILIAYLLGSVNFAILVCRYSGLQDPRALGSGNPGATNVLRTGNRSAAALTLLGDAIKGAVPVLIAAHLPGADDRLLALVAVAAFLGHLFPVYHGFKGGKGVATALGVLLGLAWPVGLAVLLIWISVFVVSRISSLSAITASVSAPIVMALLQGYGWYAGCALLMSVMLLIRHRSNITKLLSGEEKAFGKAKNP